MFLKLLKFFAKRRNAITDESPIDLQLTFSLTETTTDAAACLFTHQVAPHASQAWKYILKLSKLNLEMAFFCPGMLTKDIKD